MCTVNENHMMYGSWDMEHDGQSFLSFRTIFCPFTLLKTQKPKFWKNEKNWRYLEILSFYTRVPKIMIICHTASLSEIWSMTDVIGIFHFGLFFALFPPHTKKSENFKKMKKKPRDIIILRKYTKNHDHMLCCSWDMVRDRCNCYFGLFCDLLHP